MDESILTSIKQMLGIYDEDDAFDAELISYINGALSDLFHVGYNDHGYIIDKQTRWSEFTSSQDKAEQAKTYVFCKTRLIFDPPANSFVVDSINRTKDEAQWRFYMMGDEERIDGADNG